MTLAIARNAPTRAARPSRAPWANAFVELVKARIARTVGLPDVLPGKDGWDI